MNHISKSSVAPIVIALLCCVVGACTGGDSAGEPPIVDEDGNTLNPEGMAALLAEGGWVAEPQIDEAGETTQILVRREVAGGGGPPPGFEPPPGAIMIGESTPIRDENGNELTPDEFFERMSEGRWIPEPTLDDEGNVLEVTLRQAEEGEEMALGSAEMVDPGGDRFVSQTFPDFDFTTLDGDRVTRDALFGKITVVNFWFRACKPCMMEVPELNELVARFGDDDVVFLAFTWDKEVDAREAASKSSFAYEVVAESMSLHEELGVHSYPTHMVLDRNAVCTAAWQGYGTGMTRGIAAEIERLLD